MLIATVITAATTELPRSATIQSQILKDFFIIFSPFFTFVYFFLPKIILIPAKTITIARTCPNNGPNPVITALRRLLRAFIRIVGSIAHTVIPIPTIVQRNLFGVPKKNFTHLFIFFLLVDKCTFTGKTGIYFVV